MGGYEETEEETERETRREIGCAKECKGTSPLT